MSSYKVLVNMKKCPVLMSPHPLSFFLSTYLLTTTITFMIISHVFIETIEEIHGVQKLVVTEMLEFTVSF